jgi:hypothetical protein
VGKHTKSFKEYVEEDHLPRKKLKKESRHNYRDHLRDVIESGDWEKLEDELYDAEHSNYRR